MKPCIVCEVRPAGGVGGNVCYCPPCRREKEKGYRLRPSYRESKRASQLRLNFGLTTQQYDEILERQGGGCAICGKVIRGRSGPVDHDHACCQESVKTCGRCVRGILCTGCNVRLAALESPTWLASAQSYLSKDEKRQ